MKLSSATAWVVLLTVLVTFPAQPVEGYLTEVVTIPSGDIKLRALLGRPEGAGPFPAYIHNHGSMAFERAHGGPWPTSIAEGSLADTLAREGYVVLVLYRRGHKGSEGTTSTYSGITSGSYTDRIATDIMRGAEAETGDVIAALEYLRGQPYVDRDRVAVGGHSLGGLVSVMAVTRDRRFAGAHQYGGRHRLDGPRRCAWGIAAAFLAGCSSTARLPSSTQEELRAICIRDGGSWHADGSRGGYCEYQV